MATELREALSKEAGGEASFCEKCRQHEYNRPLTGLHKRQSRSAESAGFIVRNSLSDIIANAPHCWICAWLEALLSTRCAGRLTDIPPAQYTKVFLGISQHVITTFEKGRTYSEASRDEEELLRIAVYLDLREVGGEFHYFLNLQHSAESPVDLSRLLGESSGLQWPEHVPYTSRLRSVDADTRLLRRWKDKCLSSHSSTCKQTPAGFVPGIRLIDVKQRCIVQLDEEVAWVVLSYCWGGPQERQLLSTRLTQYQQPGALTTGILPPVIADAMTVTSALGEHYLWVDSLCIMQDSDLDKARFLPAMDAIYGRAVVTIINAATDSANSPLGLPGIRSASSRRVHTPFKLNGTWVTESLDPGHGSYQGFLDQVPWATRGWTFQEGILSRRCLIFTTDQIFWQCRATSWCEGSFWESGHNGRQIYRHCFANNELPAIFQASGDGWVTGYLAVLQKYLSRTFMSEGDRLHALTGILRVFEIVAGQRFFWGIPRKTLEHGLAFRVPQAAVRRTPCHKYIDGTGELISSPFPSWSWVGWTGNIGRTGLDRSITNGNLGLEIFCLREQGLPQRADEPPPADEAVYDDLQRRIRYPPDATHPWMDTSRQEVRPDDIPTSIRHNNSLKPSLLCFWTSTAIVKLEYRGKTRNEPYVVLSHGRHKLGGIWPSAQDPVVPDTGRVIVVGAERLRMSHGGDLTLKLLLVEDAVEDARVCRRKHLITEVREREWEGLSNRQWELVFLA